MARPVRGVPMDGKLVCSWNHRVILDLSISFSNLLYTTKFFGGFDQLDLLTSIKPTLVAERLSLQVTPYCQDP